jgi:hypothetical protein
LAFGIPVLINKHPKDTLEKINRTLALTGKAPLDSLPVPDPEHLEKSLNTIKTLFTKPLRTPTIALFIAFFMSTVTLYFLLNWIPQIVADAGLRVD